MVITVKLKKLEKKIILLSDDASKNNGRMANYAEPDQTAPRRSLIRVYTV